METSIIGTAQGPAFVRIKGSGPRIIVFHGGPGFDHQYLFEPLEFLAERRTLIFYDQPGCGQTPPPAHGPTPEHTFQHARCVIDEFSQGHQIGVIAHSWGALVFLASLALRSDSASVPQFSEGLLINPTPVTRANYEIARRNFISRLPFAVRFKVLWSALTRANGSEVMDLLLPYYSDGKRCYAPGVCPMNIATYKTMNRQLQDFDYSESLKHVARIAIARGAKDFTATDEIKELINSGSSYYELPATGHFPFFDSPDGFREIAEKVFPAS